MKKILTLLAFAVLLQIPTKAQFVNYLKWPTTC